MSSRGITSFTVKPELLLKDPCRENDVRNLAALANRRCGDKFHVVDGSLTLMGLAKRIKYVFNRAFREKTQNEVKTEISNFIGRIKKVESNDNPTKLFIKHLFFNRLSYMSEAVYDRSKIVENDELYTFLMDRENISAPHFVMYIKDYLESEDVLATFPREVIKSSFHYGLIQDGETWMDMLEKRYLLAHTYNEERFQCG